MPVFKRIKTKYPGVYYFVGTAVGSEKPERIYYIRYRKEGKLIEEKAGRQFQDDMTQARAARIRGQKIEGKQPSNQELREARKELAQAREARWTIDKLWKEYKAQKLNSKALRTDNNRYKNHLRVKFGRKEPKELVQLEVDRLRINLQKKRSPQTVKHVLALLRRIINFGVNKGLCQGTGFKIELPRVNNLKTEDLTPEQLYSLLKTIDKDKDIQAANIMRMVLLTGMRRGELFKLQWTDLDFDRGFIHIRDPKGGPSQIIPMTKAAKHVLETHPQTSSMYVFPGRGGRQRTDIKKGVNRIKKAAGLPANFRPLHGLRHTYASMMASSGKVDMYQLQKLLTHKDPRMTQRYAHLRDEALRRAANVAEELIEQAVKGKKEQTV